MTRKPNVIVLIMSACFASTALAVNWGADNMATLSTANATETLSGSQALKGIKITAANVTMAADEGASLALGSGGLTNSASTTKLYWPITLGNATSRSLSGVTTSAQTWYCDNSKALEIYAPITGTDLYIHGNGRVDVYSVNNISRYAFVGGSNSTAPASYANVYLHPGARLTSPGGIIDISCTVNKGLHLMGNTIDGNVIAGTQNDAAPSALFVEANTTNVITGYLNSQWSNQSTVSIAGHLTVQGGMTLTSTANPQGQWRPFGNGSACNNGYLKVEQKPLTANRIRLERGTMELAAAGNKVETRGLFIQGGRLKTTVANAFNISNNNKVKMESGTWDLCGNDQGLKLFCGNGGTVTSGTGAQLHVADSSYFFDSVTSGGKPASSPALNIGTNLTVCTTVFAGGAGLSKEGSLNLYIAATSTTTGTLSVAKGRLVMSRADSSVKFPGTSFTKTTGSWPNASAVEVKGGTLVVEHNTAFGPSTAIYASSGTIELPRGLLLPIATVYVTDGNGGWTALQGRCGGPDSTAANKPKYPGTDTYVFSGAGVVAAGMSLPDNWATTTTTASWTQGGTDRYVSTSANWNPTSANIQNASLLAHFSSGNEARLSSGQSVFMKGLDVSAKNFSFTSDDDSSTLFLGAMGLTNKTTGVNWNWPVSLFSADQLWWLAKSTTMNLRAPVSSSGILQLYGRGRIDVYSTNTISGTVKVGISNDQTSTPLGEVQVYLRPGAKLVTEEGTINIACRSGWGLHLMGNTIDGNVVAGTQNVTAPGAFYVEPNTTNVILGSFKSQFINTSPNNIAGHLTVRGGMDVSSGTSQQGRWIPFGNDDTCNNGYIKVENKPLIANRLSLERGTIELAVAGNKAATRGIFMTGGRLKTSVADAFKLADNNKVKMTAGTWDLCGTDQGVSLFCGNGGTVTSGTGAQLHVAYNTYFFDSLFSGVKPASSPALELGTNATVCTTVFTGGAGLSKEGSLDLYIASASSTTGKLTVTKGRLIMSKADSSATYPGTTMKKTLGSWINASAVEVKGGTLVLEHSAAFGPNTVIYASGGTIELPEDGLLPVAAVYVSDGNGGWTALQGRCGGPNSTAANKPKYPGTNNYVFSGEGMMTSMSLPGATSTTEASWTQGGADNYISTSGNWNPTTASVSDTSLFAHFSSGTEARLPANSYSALKGLDVTKSGFSFVADDDSSDLFLGAMGLTNKTTGVNWAWPVALSSMDQVWWLAQNTTMNLLAPITGSGTLQLYGRGRMDVYSTNRISGTVKVGIDNAQGSTPLGEVQVYLHPGAKLVTEEGTINIACRGGWGLHLMGNTIDGNVVAGTQNSGNPGAFLVEAGTTNIIRGFFNTQFINESPSKIAGHLTVHGGMKVGGSAQQGRWRPFGDTTCSKGYLKVVDNPLVADRIMLERGTIELAVPGNTTAVRGLFISDGLLKTTVADAFRIAETNKVKMTGGTWDLCGNDQGVSLFCGNGGTVTSEEKAQLHVAYNKYFFDSVFSGGKPNSAPALELGTNATVCTTAFTGGAGLSQEGLLDLNIAAVSSTTGKLTVASGRLIMSKADGSATYPGTAMAKTLGAWPYASAVEVTGGTLRVEHPRAFTKRGDMTIGEDGALDLAYNGVMYVRDVYLLDGDDPVSIGRNVTFGAVGSGAKVQSSLVTGTGMIMAVGEGIGVTIIFR